MADPAPTPDPDWKPKLKQRFDHVRNQAIERILALKNFDLKRISWPIVARNIAIILGIFVAILALFLASLNTPPGRRLLVQYATGIKLNSG
ncbi:MAG: hypothetical protein JF615_03555, partial [Asticcacaulis sp.]|nr:hypothetical protein [Asticcacaulis sp.]